MKLILERDALLADLQAVTRVASTRSAIQALSGVSLTASQGACELRATDADVSLSIPLRAEVLQPGAAVLPARLFLDVVRALPSPSVSLELRAEDAHVEILSGNASFRIRTLRAEDFPPFPELDATHALSVPLQAFVDTAAKVAGSASRDETRPVLTGILVSASGNRLHMVATDSYRMSIKETILTSELTGSFEANVPARALQELARLVAHADSDSLTLSVHGGQIVFRLGEATLTSRLIDGQFPNYRQLLPDSFEHELTVSGAEVRDVVRRVSLMAQKNAPLRLAFAQGELTVSAQTPDVGEARESVPVAFDGEPLEIGFNPDYLREGLDTVGEGDVRIRLISPLRPGLLQSDEAGGFTYLVMPIRLNV